MKKILAILLAVALLLTAAPVTALAAETQSAAVASSGTTGDCTWTLNGDKLTISGNGRMKDSGYKDYGYSFTELVIEPGVTYIGRDAFSSCKKLKKVTIADTVTAIGGSAFEYCEKLPTSLFPTA